MWAACFGTRRAVQLASDDLAQGADAVDGCWQGLASGVGLEEARRETVTERNPLEAKVR